MKNENSFWQNHLLHRLSYNTLIMLWLSLRIDSENLHPVSMLFLLNLTRIAVQNKLESCSGNYLQAYYDTSAFFRCIIRHAKEKPLLRIRTLLYLSNIPITKSVYVSYEYMI